MIGPDMSSSRRLKWPKTLRGAAGPSPTSALSGQDLADTEANAATLFGRLRAKFGRSLPELGRIRAKIYTRGNFDERQPNRSNSAKLMPTPTGSGLEKIERRPSSTRLGPNFAEVGRAWSNQRWRPSMARAWQASACIPQGCTSRVQEKRIRQPSFPCSGPQGSPPSCKSGARMFPPTRRQEAWSDRRPCAATARIRSLRPSTSPPCARRRSSHRPPPTLGSVGGPATSP